MSECSHAYLSAKRVKVACFRALRDIREDREDLLVRLASVHLHRAWFLPRRTMKEAFKRLSPEERGIAEWRRADEENAIEMLQGLATAAMTDDPEFRIFVSASDFRHIRAYYKDER